MVFLMGSGTLKHPDRAARTSMYPVTGRKYCLHSIRSIRLYLSARTRSRAARARAPAARDQARLLDVAHARECY
eukprot:COSAG02_NODE_346_length_24113_cov_13.213001_18_plen_74_part_00